MTEPSSSSSAAERRCRRTPRPLDGGGVRPTDVVGAFFVCAIAFLLAAAAFGLVQALSPWAWGRWLALHLAFVGGVSQLVLGAGQFFAGAFLATDPPRRALLRAQLATWNGGAILLAVAVPGGSGPATWIAVGLLLAGLALWAAALFAMRRRSLRRSRWATGWYLAAATSFALGIVAGALLAEGTAWGHGNLLGAHMALNLGGWFGAAIVGTLHTFFPSLTQTQLRYPRLQGVAFAVWGGGVAGLALGYGWDLDALALAGWVALCLGATALLANVAACLLAAPRPLSLPARVVGLAQPFLLAGLLLAAGAAFGEGPDRALFGASGAATGTLLVAGWIGFTVLGSLVHLLAVVVRVRGGFAARMPAPRPRLDPLVALLAIAGVAATALVQGAALEHLRGPAVGLLLAAYAMLAARVALLAGRVVTRARPSI